MPAAAVERRQGFHFLRLCCRRCAGGDVSSGGGGGGGYSVCVFDPSLDYHCSALVKDGKWEVGMGYCYVECHGVSYIAQVSNGPVRCHNTQCPRQPPTVISYFTAYHSVILDCLTLSPKVVVVHHALSPNAEGCRIITYLHSLHHICISKHSSIRDSSMILSTDRTCTDTYKCSHCPRSKAKRHIITCNVL